MVDDNRTNSIHQFYFEREWLAEKKKEKQSIECPCMFSLLPACTPVCFRGQSGKTHVGVTRSVLG